MQKELLVRRYAAAFVGVYYSQLTVSDRKALEKAVIFLQQHRQVRLFMRLSLLEERMQKSIVNRVAETMFLTEPFKQLLYLLITHKRSILFVSVLQAIMTLCQQKDGIMAFTIRSSTPLTHKQRSDLEYFLHTQTNAIIMGDYKQDDSLIAGIRVENGRYLWQNSIKDKLDRIGSYIVRGKGC